MGLVFSIFNFFIKKGSPANKRMSFSYSNLALCPDIIVCQKYFALMWRLKSILVLFPCILQAEKLLTMETELGSRFAVISHRTFVRHLSSVV